MKRRRFTLFYLELTDKDLRDEIKWLLGGECKHCLIREHLDIHHPNHLEGKELRSKLGGYSWAYYFDILWGIAHGFKEVILLCRECHKLHHEQYGYERQPIEPKRP